MGFELEVQYLSCNRLWADLGFFSHFHAEALRGRHSLGLATTLGKGSSPSKPIASRWIVGDPGIQ
ncbi:MAG: hypothetical protein WCP62_17110, partial [Planctomycetota bacterium]